VGDVVGMQLVVAVNVAKDRLYLLPPNGPTTRSLMGSSFPSLQGRRAVPDRTRLTVTGQ
jgi:hypothetical protein